MSIANQLDAKPPAAEESKPAHDGPQCLSRRLWDWGKRWGETLIHLVWFWRAAVLVLLVIAGVFAWHTPEFHDRVMATGVLFVLGALLVLDLFIAFLNLPLLLFYTLLWIFLTLTALADLLLYGRHLRLKHNRIALWVLLGNVALVAAIFSLWRVLHNPPEVGEPAESVAAVASAVRWI